LLGFALCAASLGEAATASSAAAILSGPCRRLSAALSTQSGAAWAQAWAQVLELVDSSGGASMPPPVAPLEIVPWSLSEADREFLCSPQDSWPEELVSLWPAASSVPAALAARVPASEVANGADSGGGPLRVDLYADPAAKKAQDAVIAALPPQRRVEALLSSAKPE
ncbi:unnamed protein product, partial [Polarella glacialis]